MKQIISFKKDIPFNTKIGEITSISLEHNLKAIDTDQIAGEFIVSGDYKITDVSVNREPFSYNLPFDIALDTRYNIDNAKIDIDDFYYEIINDQILNVNIDVLINGIEVFDDFKVEKESVEMNNSTNVTQVRNEEEFDFTQDEEVDNRKVIDLFKEIETPAIDVSFEKELKPEFIIDNNTAIDTDEKIKSLFDSFDDSNETFTTYHVHIVRENDTIESIVTKYNTTKEEISAYNKIDELKLGDKIVIPAITDD
jgi:hypothetical protein